MGQDPIEEVLVGGPQGPRLRERFSRRWRQRDAVAIALLLGMGIGAFGTILWNDRSNGAEGQDVHLAASLSLAYRYHEQAVAVLTIYNLDAKDPVTIHDVDLKVAGLRVIGEAWDSSPDPPVAVLANSSHDVVTQLSMDCSEDVGRFGQVVFSAAVDDESPEGVTDPDTPVAPTLQKIHENYCTVKPRRPNYSGLIPHPLKDMLSGRRSSPQ